MKFFEDIFKKRKLDSAKKHWVNKYNECVYGPIIFSAVEDDYRNSMKNILEFGSNWGGNLRFFMDNIPGLKTVGVDINKTVLETEKKYQNYKGVIGDEKTLSRFNAKEFDLAFTISVLDHIPSDKIVRKVIEDLLKISKITMLLEPFVEGIHGDVSHKTRDQIKKGLPRGYKQFAAHSYLWNYDKMLDEIGMAWLKIPTPLHAFSLGPFYHLYCIPSKNIKDISKIKEVADQFKQV